MNQLIILVAAVLCFGSFLGPAIAQESLSTAGPGPEAGYSSGTDGSNLSTQGQQDSRERVMKSLSPQQQSIVQQEINKSGGTLTPEAVKALKERPEFKSLTPEEIAKGKAALSKRTEGEEKKSVDKIQKQMPAVSPGQTGTLFNRMKNLKGYQDIPIDLNPFGFDFFKEGSMKVIADRQDIPVPTNYVIGPGDEVKVLLWGRLNAQHSLVVDKDGNITIPQIGPLPVAGMTFEQMSVSIIQQVEKIIGSSVNVTMGRLKSIPVFILGDVARPGAYTLGSFTTITDALIMAGGPSPIGSLRNVQLKRKGKVVTAFDFYDLLLKGDKSKDAMLQAGDVVFVPVTGALVGIAGNVKRPAIYELKGRQSLKTIIELAGGILPTAYTQQIQVERIISNEREIVIDIDDKRLSSAADFILSDADLVKIFNLTNKEENVVQIQGNVKRPGKYEYRKGMKVKDLINNVRDLDYETYLDYALIKRTAAPGSQSENGLLPFNLGKLLLQNDESQNIELRPMDTVYVFSKWFFADKPSFTVEGAVRNGGNFDLVDNLRLRDAVLLAGGMARDASFGDVELYRMDPVTKGRFIEKFNLRKALDGDPQHNVLLRDFDRVTVMKIRGLTEERRITISGEVAHPGKYAVERGEKLSSVLERVGGYSENAYLRGAVFTRVRVKEMQKKALDEMIVRLERDSYVEGSVQDTAATPEARKIEMEQRKKFIESLHKIEPSGRMSIKLVHLRLLKGSAFDIELEDGDTLEIPTKNSVVNVTGAVMSPGSFVYLNEMDHKGYIAIAGGYTRHADKAGIFVLKADGTARRVTGGFMQWSQTNSRWEMAAFNEEKNDLDPGDTIIVPEKLERIAWLRELKDWTQILMNISVIGATVNYMFK